MAFEILRGIGHCEITAATDVVALALSYDASPFLSLLAVLAQIGYLFELLLATAAVALGAIGVLRCFGLSDRDFGAARINEKYNPANDQRRVQEDTSERNVEVTVRLENGFFRTLRKHRCIVTIQRSSDGSNDIGREVWYARGGK